MRFTWKYYLVALALWAVRHVGDLIYGGVNVIQLIGAYFGDLFLVYLGFHIYKWYKMRDKVE